MDHVDRKKRQFLVAHPLTTALDADNLPPNVLIVLSSRYPEALPESIVNHVFADPNRRISMQRFDSSQVRQFFKLRGIVPSDDILEPIVSVSGGVPIYLEYLADQFGEMNHYEQKQYLDSIPSLRDNTIDAYHQQLWSTCRDTERLVYILAILAVRDEFTTPDMLRELLKEVGVYSTLDGVCQDVKRMRHVLRVSDAENVAIRHSSLAEFINEQTVHLRVEVNQAMVAWYGKNPESDEAWRNRFRHMWECEKYVDVLSICDHAWLNRAWELHRPYSEIQRNLDVTWRAAAACRDTVEFIRVALLKQRVATVFENLEVSDVDVARLLLRMGKPREALRKVWDGERRQCRQEEFAEFCLHYMKSTGHPPPDHVMKSGMGNEPSAGAKFGSIRAWYRAQSLVGDPVKLLEEIGCIRWQQKQHEHIKNPVNTNHSNQMNFKLQTSVLRELFFHRKHDSLDQVHAHATLLQTLRVSAGAMRGLLLAQRDEHSEARRLLNGLNLACLREEDKQWLFLGLAELGLDGILDDFTSSPPDLPQTLLNSNEQDFNERFLGLYDKLRCFFLCDETGFPWFESIVTGCPEPARTPLTAIGRLASVWLNLIRREIDQRQALRAIKDVVKILDLKNEDFAKTRHPYNYKFSIYREGVQKLYEQVWSCAKLLQDDALTDLGKWWSTTNESELALCYPEATRALAKVIQARTLTNSEVCMRLLDVAERGERLGTEPTSVGTSLLKCASAWAECGFPDEAHRLWGEVFSLACGFHERRDYEFSLIRTALELAHMDDPDGSLDRVREQLVLAYQMVPQSSNNTLSTAVERLIEFLARVDPALAFAAVYHEEALIHRDRTVHNCVLALIDCGLVDRRLVLSVAATVGRWSNYREFDDYAKPAMFSIFSDALAHNDFATARSAYDFWRQVLLVEKQMPEEIGRWAAAWVNVGSAPADVNIDYARYSTKGDQGPADSNEPETDFLSRLSNELDSMVENVGRLDARLEEGIGHVLRTERMGVLSEAQDNIRVAYFRAAGNAGSETETETFGRKLCRIRGVLKQDQLP